MMEMMITAGGHGHARRVFPAVVALVALAAAASCSANISGRVEKDASGSLSLKAALTPAASRMFRSLQGTLRGNAASGAPALDSAAINRSLEAAPGIKSAALKNTTSDAVEGTIAVASIGGFLTPAGGKTRFAVYEPSPSGGGALALRLDRETGAETIRLFSRDAADYLSALMAPVVTGEKLGRAAYLELVRSIYGEGLATEIAAAKIAAAVTFPAPVKSVKGGSFSGREARFVVSLLDILVLEQPLEYEIVW